MQQGYEMAYTPKTGHIKKPLCPHDESELYLSVDVDNMFSMIWCCEKCDFKAEQATGNITTVVTKPKDMLQYNLV